jgi:methyl-accepting chemotaxis protein
MQRRLARLAQEVRETAGTVAESAVQVSAGSANLSSRTEEQATTLEETAASMEQVTASARDSAANSGRANDIAQKAVAAAHGGGKVVDSAVDKINAIQESSRKIAEIIGVIDGIAFQTNILALNAAVEAARAGEQGRGFAVVASEVRALAQRSATAAREIKALIGASASHVEAGTALIHQAGGAMKHIVTANEEVVKVIAAIASAMADQAGSIEQINNAITQLETVTQQNAALVEQAAATAESMRDRAQALQDLTHRFKLAGGAAAHMAPATAAPLAAEALPRARLRSALPWRP